MSENPIAPSVTDAFPPLEEITADPVAAPLTPLAIVLVLVSIPIAALLVGGAWHLISYLSDFPILFPIFAGCGAGWFVGNALKWGKVKKHRWAAWCGLAAALLTMLSRHLWDAYSEHPLMVLALSRRIQNQQATQHKPLPLAQINRAVEETLTPWNTLRLHLETSASVGTTLQMYSRRIPLLTGQRFRLRGAGYWILLVLDTAVAGFAGALIAEGFALRRYCPECNKPLKQYLLFQRKEDQIDAMLSLTRAQDWDALKSLPKEKLAGKSHAAVTLLQCEEGGCPATVVVEQTNDGTPNRRFLNAWVSPESAKAARAASFAELL